MEKALADFQSLAKQLLADEKVNPMAEFIPAEELFDRLDLSLNEEGIDDETHLEKLKELIIATPRTATNAFFNQLYGGRNEKAVLGELLAVLLNNSMYTYKAAGPQIGVEKAVIQKVVDIIGWGENAGGAFATGGSMTNFMSMLMARDAANGKIRFQGVQQKMTVYTSIESHYSIPKNASFSGIGRDNVRYIPVNKVGEMNPEDLDKAIAKDINDGFTPVLVNATAGTTVLGAFDNVEQISAVCQKYNVWMHVDGAYCGSVIFSEKYKHFLKGLEHVNSFSFNAHKMIGTPLTCSMIFVKDKKHLRDSFANEAEYLFQTDEDEFNLGKTSLQCGRRNDALKFWTFWKSVGTKGLEKLVDHQFALADTARDYIKNHPDYTFYSFDDSISVCFNYKKVSPQKLCTALYEKEKLMVSHGTFQENDFVRFVTINGQNKHEDILAFFKTLEAFVDENYNELVASKSIGETCE
ncbi:pyridoxal phosphate-dependent decarboxylase family protein [Brumimicrobium aurantiacum]|uniref:Aminotransferase class V-fold PLP-dependent enzyme n=1 Tax=Brumimicrobium aurantiacum TaxID=1737063 RepID=A0A3E1EVM6_9FLAO|nr:aminotransferase class V-fold PLP-dependent enzyme [Brumimicrobium aurantiacum]RFC53543.1 aminotransferase class V-fold PLP-dependent enzyme [Brumimicrobium aurantiacum]